MRKALILGIVFVVSLVVAGCAGKGKTPLGKGKEPVVTTRG